MKKHGYLIETEILKECSSKEELKHWGKYYSNLWNIVESSEWANLKPEEGDGGATRNGMKNKPCSAETREKIAKANRGRTQSIESRLKNRNSNLGMNNGMFGLKHGIEARNLMSISRKGRDSPTKGKIYTNEERKRISKGTKLVPKMQCSHCSKLSSPGNHTRWHGDNCKSKVD